MNQYCVKCGKEIRKGTTFCPNCGQKLSTSAHQTDEWSAFGNFLAQCSLGLAKGFLYLLVGGIIFACTLSGIGMLIIGVTLLYHFATSNFLMIPAILTPVFDVKTLSGAPLVFGGVVALFIAILFVVAVISIVRAMLSLRNQGKPSAAD